MAMESDDCDVVVVGGGPAGAAAAGGLAGRGRGAGTTVLNGGKARAAERAPDAIVVRGRGAAGPWQLRARLLLGADGSNSMVARTLRGGGPPRRGRILAGRAHFA